MRLIITAPAYGIRIAAVTATELHDVLTDLIADGYCLDEIEIEIPR